MKNAETLYGPVSDGEKGPKWEEREEGVLPTPITGR